MKDSIFIMFTKCIWYMRLLFHYTKRKSRAQKKIVPQNKPYISIITSVYDGDAFIDAFLVDMVQQTIFHKCELILVNAASPGTEEQKIFEYMREYSNIIYVKLSYDPGLYAVWNYAIRLARGTYITNANLDDRVAYECYEKHSTVLDNNAAIDLVYSDIYVTYVPNESVQKNSAAYIQTHDEFSVKSMQQSLPNDHPMWRRSLHDRYGLFNEQFKIAGDWEFWLRAVKGGARFKKVPGVLGLHYVNPTGLSTNEYDEARLQENELVKDMYKELLE